MSIFERSINTYAIDPDHLIHIQADPANPLHQAVKLIKNNSRVLDIGAGNGILSRLAQYNGKQILIDGIEIAQAAADLAKPYYRNFYHGHVEDFVDILNWDEYDYIVLIDVIEHIANPSHILKIINDRMRIDSQLIISTPNISYCDMRYLHFWGQFDYVDSGILERTHLRFFTKSTLKTLFAECGFSLNQLINLQRHTSISTPLQPLRLITWLLSSLDRESRTFHFLALISKNATLTIEQWQTCPVTSPFRNFIQWLQFKYCGLIRKFQHEK